PNSSDNPSVTVNAPPKPPSTPISSPRRMTRSSRRISSRRASRSASTMLSSRPCWLVTSLFGEYIGKAILRTRIGALLGHADGAVQLALDVRLDSAHVFGFEKSFCQEPGFVGGDGIAPFPGSHFFRAPVVTRITARVACEPVGFEFEKRRTGAAPGARTGRGRRVVDGLDVVAIHGHAGNPVRSRPLPPVSHPHDAFDRRR